MLTAPEYIALIRAINGDDSVIAYYYSETEARASFERIKRYVEQLLADDDPWP